MAILDIFFLDIEVSSTAGVSSSPAITVSPMNRAYVFPTPLSAVRLVRLENPRLMLNTIPFLIRWVHFELRAREPSRNSIPVIKLWGQSTKVKVQWTQGKRNYIMTFNHFFFKIKQIRLVNWLENSFLQYKRISLNEIHKKNSKSMKKYLVSSYPTFLVKWSFNAGFSLSTIVRAVAYTSHSRTPSLSLLTTFS